MFIVMVYFILTVCVKFLLRFTTGSLYAVASGYINRGFLYSGNISLFLSSD